MVFLKVYFFNFLSLRFKYKLIRKFPGTPSTRIQTTNKQTKQTNTNNLQSINLYKLSSDKSNNITVDYAQNKNCSNLVSFPTFSLISFKRSILKL